MRTVLKTCACGNQYYGDSRKPILCRTCRGKRCAKAANSSPEKRKQISQWASTRFGSNSPTWKGGHRYYVEGKHGRDKDGLSWKQQRLKAWERDDYTCQHCGKVQEGWRPDVHHKIPYRISGSHALENLTCLCRSCHKVADEKYNQGLAQLGRAPALGAGGQRFEASSPDHLRLSSS